jgi:hypothetical protein
METRSIAIGLIAIVAAFAAAFGVAKSGGSKTETAGAGVKAQTIKVASPAAVAGVEVGGTLPALKAERKPAKKKKKPSSETNTSSSTATTPSATAEPTTPSTNNTTPPATNTNPTPPANNNPPPAKKEPPVQSEEPASGGGEDG